MLATNYVRMVIGETIGDDQTKELVQHLRDLTSTMGDTEPEFTEAKILAEDGGNMAILVTQFKSREACLRFHSSRLYRQFVATTQHLLVGDYVVKLFHGEEA